MEDGGAWEGETGRRERRRIAVLRRGVGGTRGVHGGASALQLWAMHRATEAVCVHTEVRLRFPSHSAREERGARWKDEALLESVVCASGKQMMVSTSCWQCDTCTSAVLRLGMGARDGAPRVAETRGDARRSLPKESGMDHGR